MLAHCRVIISWHPALNLLISGLYTWVERGTVRVKCLPKNTVKCPQPGLKPIPLDLEWSMLIMRPFCLTLASETFA